MPYGTGRYAVVRSLAAGALVLAGAGLLGACGTGGTNSDQVCTDTRKAFQQYMAQVRSVSAADPAQWKQATEQLAVRVDGLAGKAEDKELRKALKGEAERLRTAAATVGGGDVAQLNTVMSGTPQRIGTACA